MQFGKDSWGSVCLANENEPFPMRMLFLPHFWQYQSREWTDGVLIRLPQKNYHV